MKFAGILFPAVIFFNTVFAQSAMHNFGPSQRHISVLAGLLQSPVARSSMRTASTGVPGERVIAQSTHDSTSEIIDSVNLKYTTYCGSVYDYNMMDYAYNYPYAATPMFNFDGIFTKPQVLYDTIRHWTIDPFTLAYGMYETGYAGYDSNKNLSSFYDLFTDSVNNQNMSYANTFTTAGNIVKGNWFDLNAGTTDSAFRQFFSYNSANRLTKDSLYEYHGGIWHLVARSFYTYNDSGDLTQIDAYANTTDTTFLLPLIEQTQYINTYDSGNRLKTVLTNLYDGTSLSSYVKDTFGYSGTHTYHNSWTEYQYDPINGFWTPLSYMTKQINASGVPDTVNIQSWDSLASAWIPYSFYSVKYDTSKNPDTLREYDYNFTTFPDTASFTTVYYYGPYENTTAVNNVQPHADNTIVYPNPATGVVTIANADLMTGSMVTVTLINVSGQVVSRTAVSWQGACQVPVGTLKPGIYWIVLQDEQGNMVHRQSVIRQ